MNTNQINHRQCLFSGAGIRHLVREIAKRSSVCVDDVVSEMHGEMSRPRRFSSVDMVTHKSRQYIACAGCGKAITMDDVDFNQCANCGTQVLSK